MTSRTNIFVMARPARRSSSKLAHWEAIWGLIFLSPWVVGFLAFTLLPMIASLAFSFTNFNLVHPEETRFIGLSNYINLFQDRLVRVSLLVTGRFAIIAVPAWLALPLGLAALLNARHLFGKPIFRLLFYLPSMVLVVSVLYIWMGFLNTQEGWLNRALGAVGISGPDWLNSPVWIYPALAIIGFWSIGNAIVTMLAGMQGVPTELYDAAKVDGAGPVYTFFKITIPLISPVIFFNLVLGVITISQYFVIPYLLTSGINALGDAAWFYNLYLYKTAFAFADMGYGAALAWLLFVIVLVITIVLFGTAKYWVYYAGERG